MSKAAQQKRNALYGQVGNVFNEKVFKNSYEITKRTKLADPKVLSKELSLKLCPLGHKYDAACRTCTMPLLTCEFWMVACLSTLSLAVL